MPPLSGFISGHNFWTLPSLGDYSFGHNIFKVIESVYILKKKLGIVVPKVSMTQSIVLNVLSFDVLD